jgi:hypothetical protein
MVLEGCAKSSVKIFKNYVKMWSCFQRHIWNLVRGSLFQITTFIEQTTTRVEKANELPLQLQEDHWYIWHIYLITDFGCPIFQNLGRKQNL